MRSYLVWGWYLDLKPTSESVSLAYADGLRRFGAQPFSRPDENYYSYIQSDWGKTYCSHDISGKTIEVHQNAFGLEEGFRTLLTQKHVGLVNDFDLIHLKARPYNAREKPVERLGKDLSDWEANTFAEYCGKNASERPDKWYEMYEQHQNFVKGKIKSTPFIPLEEYHQELSAFFETFNHTVHHRSTLEADEIIPIKEYKRLYQTKYKIPEIEIALLLLKADKRVVRKNGVRCFRRNWYYMHPSLSQVKGEKIQIRYTSRDYSSIYAVLPDNEVCKAELITPTSIINPNKETLQQIAKLRRQENEIIKNYQLISESEQRGENIDDRYLAQESKICADEAKVVEPSDSQIGKGNVIKFSKFKRNNLKVVKTKHSGVSVEEVEECEEAEVKVVAPAKTRVREI